MKKGIVWQGYELPVSVKRVEPVEKLIVFGLIKNAQMQGARNPEE